MKLTWCTLALGLTFVVPAAALVFTYEFLARSQPQTRDFEAPEVAHRGDYDANSDIVRPLDAEVGGRHQPLSSPGLQVLDKPSAVRMPYQEEWAWLALSAEIVLLLFLI